MYRKVFFIALFSLLTQVVSSQGNYMTGAQSDTTDIKTLSMDEVVVTATRTPHSIYSVPASMSMISKRSIDNSPAIYIDEALRGISGVYVKRSKLSDQTASVSLRGFSGDARTLVLLDGIPLNDGYNQGVSWGGIPTDAISKVEVVKGSFSSLYGGSAMGGVINILTDIPREEAFSLKSGYGTYNTINTSASYSNRFLKNKQLSVFLSMNQKSSDGYASNYYQTTAREGAGAYTVTGWEKTTNNRGADYYLLGHIGDNWMRQTQLYGKIAYEIKPGSTLDFSVSSAINSYGYRNSRSFLRDETTGLPVNEGAVTLNDGGASKTITIRPYSFLNGPGNGFTNTYKLYYKTMMKNVRLSSYAGFLDDKSEYITVASGATEDGGPGTINSSKPKRTYIANVQADIPVSKHLLSVGADYKMYVAGVEEWNLSDWRDDGSKTTMRFSMDGKQSIIAPFAQAEMNIVDGLKGYLGVRYDYWRNIDGKGTEAAADTVYVNTSKGQFSPKAGIVYTPEMNGNVFKIKSIRASAGQSFRTPTLYNLYRTWSSSTVTYLSNPDLKPETSFSWEVGFSLSLLNDWTKISFDYFRSYVRDLLYSSEIATGFRKQMNAANGEIKGFEIEIRQNIFSLMDINFNITKQDTEITENTAEPNSTGKRFTNVPDLLYNAGANFYKGPVSFMLSYNFTGKVYSASDNSDAVQGVYGSYDEQKLLDGKISYKLNEDIALSLSVNNILDREYFLYYKAPGRTCVFGVSAKF
ncbi:MAG: TonB-dependent receptor [Bacteroidales bacterium]|jgi:iron complex outermembrane receptor protein|nr:TonB-dependent receptor [Bacteroidales bacterium]